MNFVAFVMSFSRKNLYFCLVSRPRISTWVLAAAARALILPVLDECKIQRINKELASIYPLYIFVRSKLTRFIISVLGSFEPGKFKNVKELLIVKDEFIFLLLVL